jgi:hypothetical protein
VFSDICLANKATGMCSLCTRCLQLLYVCQWNEILESESVFSCECLKVFVRTYD